MMMEDIYVVDYYNTYNQSDYLSLYLFWHTKQKYTFPVPLVQQPILPVSTIIHF